MEVENIRKFFNLLQKALDETSDSVKSRAPTKASQERLAAQGIHFVLNPATLKDFRLLMSAARGLPKTPEFDGANFIKLLLIELLKEGDDRDTIPILLNYMRELFRERYLHNLKFADDRTILGVSLSHPEFHEIAICFFHLATNALNLGLITQSQYERAMPHYTVQKEDGTFRKRLDGFELFFPDLEYYYQRAKASFDAGTGFFWIPDSTDVNESGQLLPIRLFTPAERAMLAIKYPEDPPAGNKLLQGYARYCVTSKHLEPAITEATFEKLWDCVQRALLIEYRVTEETHAAEVNQRISKKESEDYSFRSLTRKEKVFFALRELQDEALEVYTAVFLSEYFERVGWPGGLPERKRLENQVLCLKGIYTDSKVITYTTLANLFYLMAPDNRASSTCAHTIWGRILFLLMDYSPGRRLDDRIEQGFSEYLEIARQRSRSRTFATPAATPSALGGLSFLKPSADADSKFVAASHTTEEASCATDTGLNNASDAYLVARPQDEMKSFVYKKSASLGDLRNLYYSGSVSASPIRELMQQEKVAAEAKTKETRSVYPFGL